MKIIIIFILVLTQQQTAPRAPGFENPVLTITHAPKAIFTQKTLAFGGGTLIRKNIGHHYVTSGGSEICGA